MRNVKVPNWLEELPLAPEYHPTDTEFADPIAYISKIEKEASKYGICKIIPPLPKPSKNYVISNLTKSLSKRPELDHVTRPTKNRSRPSAVFTTRQQELGNNGKTKLVCKQVWQSGEVYTLDQFESKAKDFYRERLGDVKSVSPLVIETLFWEAACGKPIYIEYANDVPGSGFSEPVGPCRFLNNKRRRKRTNFRRSCASMKSKVEPDVFSGKELKGLDSRDNMEGSSGWKLSNSPWNLQLIARSLGSLTRFMADDIPGVTSPMVYIGMLFSWFAWHVEDHELHSMNFLHTGSQKTWYAVPGYYAVAFEDVVRRQAYGIDVDRLDSLTMLGEKTTLLSPEAIVDSGIPCCRLVQNPGEFVVTFPRAYHVGFSHGFNCGEAANFGTAKWLEVAREAAVRRAAMNHLPMLSHQQLLYLLTMSFVSSIPRSLLPGARNSRLRDRLKNEREFSVKKAFLDDILNENKLLRTVLRRSGSNRVVLWDLESLPSVVKVPEPCSPSNTVVTAVEDNISTEKKNKPDLLREMNVYMENVNDLYIDTDDLSGDFQLCSGSLACVACGVLGFPFMSVIQPSERASMNLMEDVSMAIHDHSHSLPLLNGMVDPDSVRATENIGRCERNLHDHSNGESLTRDPYPIEVPTVSVGPQVQKGWCSTRGFLRPRIFCLEHAVHIKHMLNLKGGANVLVICHSDFKKMEVHAAAIKEQIGSPSRYSEVPLDSATQDDLNIIDLAIDDEEHDEYGNDWTSKLGINLRHCVKMRRNFPCKPEHHSLVLGGLFSGSDSSFNSFDLKWRFTKSRSKNLKKASEYTKIGSPGLGNLNLRMERETGQLLVVKSDADTIRNKPKLIQYSRRISTFEPGDSMVNETLMKQVPNEALVTDCGDQNEHRSPKNFVVQTECSAKESSGLSISASTGNCNSQFDTAVPVFSQAMCPVAPGDRNTGDSRGDDFEMRNEMEVDNGSKKIVTSGAEDSTCSVVAGIYSQRSIIQGENKNAVDVSVADAGCIDNYDNYSSEGILRMKETCNLVAFAPSCCSDTVTAMSNAQREEKEVERYCVEKEGILQGTYEDKEPASISEIADCVEKQGVQGTHEVKEPASLGDTLIDESSVVLKDVSREVSITNAVGEMHDGFLSSHDTGELETAVLNMVWKKSPIKYRRKRRRELHLQVDIQGTNEAKEPAPCSDALINQCYVVLEDVIREVSLTNAVAETPPTNEELEKVSLTMVSQKSPVKYRRKRRRELDLKVDNPGVHEAKEPVPCHDTQVEQTYLVPRDMIMSPVSIINAVVEMHSDDNHTYPDNGELGKVALAMVCQNSIVKAKRVRRRELDLQFDNPYYFDGFTRSPCEGLRPRSSNHIKCGKIDSNKVIKKNPAFQEACEGVRPRSSKPAKGGEVDISKITKEKPISKKSTKPSNRPLSRKDKKRNEKKTHKCDLVNCKMWFHTKKALKLHKRNQCPLKGCGKKFSCHRYAVVHQRVHDDDRPLKCLWKGCGMTFKWSWSKIEHMRKHTGERPYSCKVEGCGLSFRFISDYSRHRRKTGHYVTPQT